MTEVVLNTDSLPEFLFRMIHSKKVKVNETDGIINLIPIVESKEKCSLLGLAADSRLTADNFFAMTHDKTEMN